MFFALSPARNSDLWLHLATGRALVSGQTGFGTDPFLYTTSDTQWVNPAWLTDVSAYAVESAFGLNALMIAKAIACGLTALVLLLACKGRERWRPAIAWTGLAVIAMGTWLPLQPVIMSYLFLSVTIWLLTRSHEHLERSAFRRYWKLLPLFALWANLDEWFILGPAAVALHFLGMWNDGSAESDVSVKSRVLFLAASFGACLVNPFFHAIFRIPAELLLPTFPEAFRNEGIAESLAITPFDRRFLFPSHSLVNPGAVAFWLMALLSLGTLALPARRSRFYRALFWTALFALAACHARAIPFFAIAIAPIAAMPFQVQSRKASTRWHALRSATLPVSMLLLLAGSWTGWLIGPPFGPRRLAVDVDPSLKAAAERLASWRHEQLLDPEWRTFSFSPEMAHYLAWFCPNEKSFFDSRLGLLRGVAGDYAAVRRVLRRADLNAGHDVLRRHKIALIIVSDPDAVKAHEALRHLFADQSNWALLAVAGRTSIFGWREAPDSQQLSRLTPSLEVLAFASDNTAPRTRPISEPVPRSWLDDFDTPRPGRSAQRDEAAEWLFCFESLHAARLGQVGGWEASMIASAVLPLSSLSLPATTESAIRLRMAITDFTAARPTNADELFASRLRTKHFRLQSNPPPASLYLAIRAARRALHENSGDSAALLTLGEAYTALSNASQESHWTETLPRWRELRRYQAIAAYVQAVRLNPDSEIGHAALAAIYRESRSMDLALKHLKEQARIRRKLLAGAAGDNPQVRDASRALDNAVNHLEKQVAAVRSRLNLGPGQRVYERARLANLHALPSEALSILLGSDLAAFGRDGLRLEMELLLEAGRTAEAREWLVPEHMDALGEVNYWWLRVRIAAAEGDYERADKDMQRLGASATSTSADRPAGTGEADVAIALGRALLEGAVTPANPIQLVHASNRRSEAIERGAELIVALRHNADIDAMRGLLALEQGDIAAAAARFQAALYAGERLQHSAQKTGMLFYGFEAAQAGLEAIRAGQISVK